ncbi:hypothetical protein P153DRAFT_367253 [Dothidotthia symphoricarpi CBS 119687]|uniref:Uncharacterized protein n=1 Tax=Dothidotthia symphoricarpi CBS 119687 TaxID=1392245 RepID=A0A6A6ADB1_9PLEO|nr:uncharacterized protein P153DRAFT_367253 [Dothidotthia symphoricarpi CBS 119687]KAF2128954.1 hypothetical protein P153DRAFT_367253 [Dothidotthia symphoricarpi CBS 119687]
MYSEHRFPYPDPDSIRHFHTLHSFLPHLQPERKLGALDGPTIDIVEQHSGTIYIQNVPKKMLVLFLGRQTVNKFLRTIERVDNVNWRGGPTRQELRLPRGCASSSALEILIVWMRRACQHQTMGDMKQFLVPVNLFAACSLGSTLELFGLRKDALRVEMFIGKNHFQRPIFAVEMKALWSCLGETSRYTYGAIKVLGQRFRAYENGTEKKLLRDFDQILELLEAFPLLGARVRDGCLNERYAPTFGTKWFSKISDGV